MLEFLSCHGTCLNIDVHGTNSGGKSHGGSDKRLLIAKRSVSYKEDLRDMFPVCQVLRTCSSGFGRWGWHHRWSTFLWCFLTTEPRFFKVKA
jgi:hypothetical protein